MNEGTGIPQEGKKDLSSSMAVGRIEPSFQHHREWSFYSYRAAGVSIREAAKSCIIVLQG